MQALLLTAAGALLDGCKQTCAPTLSVLHVDGIPVWRAEHAGLFGVSCCVLRGFARTLFCVTVRGAQSLKQLYPHQLTLVSLLSCLLALSVTHILCLAAGYCCWLRNLHCSLDPS